MHHTLKTIQNSTISDLSSNFKGKIGRNIIHIRSTSSTQDAARSLAESNSNHPELQGTVIVADEQLKGRGRFGRAWISNPGDDILMSVILKPRPAIIGQITIMAALSCALTIDDFTKQKHKAQIKWPNDVLVQNKKIGGIIAEAFGTQNQQIIILGIGLNLNLNPNSSAAKGFKATSLRHISQSTEKIHRTPIIYILLKHINELYDALQRGETIIPEWKARLATIGQNVTVATMSEQAENTSPIIGTAQDVDEFGRLIVKDAHGHMHALAAGEVTLRKN